MAAAFNLTAQLNLKGPSNIGSITSSIKKQLGTITANVDLKINTNSIQKISQLNAGLQQLNKTLSATTVSATSAASAIKGLGQAFGAVNLSSLPQQISATSTALGQVKAQSNQAAKALAASTTQMEEFGKQSALAVRRFAAFSIVTSSIYALSNSINKGIEAFIEYDQQFVKLQQVTGQSADGLKSLSQEITSLSVGLGVSSAALTDVASTLAQAGLNAQDTEKALKALALSSLAPSFDSMNETVEGSIALMRQFGISAGGLEGALGSVNTVAAKFAVEASDIITAVQRTGGVFATASKGVSEGTDALNEFIAVFTSIRATTRESAETIATGLRTIFTRIQRGSTIDALKEFGVNLQDTEGKFVGAYKAVELLSKGLSSLDPRDVKFSKIVEELGGFRQIGKVIPLIQQFSVAQNALKIAQQGQGSLAKDAATAQLSLANQIQKVRQEFLALFRDLGQSQGFQVMVKASLSLASALIKVADASKGLLPLLGVMLAFKGASAITQFASGFGQGLKPGAGKKNQEKPLFSQGGPVRAFASGGVVPGSGDGDTVPAMLTPGEFVIRKKAVQAIGSQNLHKMNKYAKGGPVALDRVSQFSSGKQIPSYIARYSKVLQDKDEIEGEIDRRTIGQQEIEQYYESNPHQQFSDYIKKRTSVYSTGKKSTIKQAGGYAFEDFIGEYISKKDGLSGYRKTKDPKAPLDFVGGEDPIEVRFRQSITPDETILAKRFRHGMRYSTSKILSKFTPKIDNRPPADIGKSIVYQVDPSYKKAMGFAFGGKIQKFLKGGTVEETAELENMSLQDAILAQIKEMGGIKGVKGLLGVPGGQRTLDSLLRSEVIKKKDTLDPTALKAVNDALSNEEGKKIRRAQAINKSQKLAVVGLQPFDKSTEIPFDIPGFESSTIFVRGLSSKYADAVSGMREMVENTIEKFGTDIQSTMVFGGNAPLALDFDETLVSGADIFGPNGKPDIPAYSDLDKVAKALNGDKVKLTPLGEKIKEIAGFDPSFINRIRVLTARPQSNAGLLSEKLNELGIPLGADKITGVSGGNKGAAMGMTERLIDDNIKNINDAKKAGKSAVQYAELRKLSEEEKAATGNANAEGAILEAALAKMGAIGGSVQNRAVDFEHGLGMAAAQAFPGISPDWPTEVKRTLSSDNIGRAKEEFKRYYTETYGPFPQQEDAFGFDKAGMPVSRFAMGGKASRKVDYEAGVGPSPFGGSVSKRLSQSVYNLQKGTGLNDQEFNEIKKTADTYGYNEKEFQEYLAKRIQEKKNKSGLKSDPSALLRAITPGPNVASQRQLDLAEQLKGTRGFAAGGSIQDTVPALLTPGEFVVNKQAAQRIGYSKLHQLNHADKVAGYNKGGMVGGVQGYASGGTVSASEIAGSIIDWLKTQPGAVPPPKLGSRPDNVNRSTVQASGESTNSLKELVKALNELKISAASSASVLNKGGALSYKAIEKALQKDIERMKVAGISIDTILAAEQTLADIRKKGKGDVKDQQKMETMFGTRGKTGTKILNGMTVGDLAGGSAAGQQAIDTQAKSLAQKRIASYAPGSLSPEDEGKITKKSYLDTAARVTGAKKSDFKAAGISGSDIQQYIAESMRDRKTLSTMDKQLITLRMEEYKNAGTVRGISANSTKEAKALADEEVSQRREIINDLAKVKGEKGVGAAGLMDFRNSPILKRLKGITPSQYLTGAAATAGFISSSGDSIAKGLYNTDTDKGKLKAAKTGAAISSAGAIASTGLGIAAQSLAIPVIGPYVAAITVVGTGLVALGDSLFDFTGSQEKATREVEKALRASEINAATASLDDAFKRFENDMSNIDLQEALNRALSNSVMAQTKDSSANINDAKRDYAYQNRSWGDLLTGSFKGSAQMDAKQLAEVNRAEAEKFAPMADKGYKQIQNEINSGASIEQIMSNDKLGGARRAITMSDPQSISEYTAKKAAEEKATGKPITEEASQAIIDEIAARKISTNEFIISSTKAKEVADALEMANLAGRKLAQSFQRLYDSIDQAINKNNFNIQQRKTSIDYSTGALSGNAATPELNSKNINILDNPKAYSAKDFEGAIGAATQSLPAEDAKMIKGAATLQRNLAPAIEAELRKTLSTDAGLTAEKAAEKAKEIGTAQVKERGLPKEMEETIINQLNASIDDKVKEDNVKNEFKNGPKAATDKFIESIRVASDTIIENAGKGGIDTLKKLLSSRQDIFNDFAKNLAKSSSFLKQHAESLVKAKNIIGDAKMNLREALTGVGETFAEAKTRFDSEISDLTGGTTDPKAISANIQNLQKKGEGLVKQRDNTNDDAAIAKFTTEINKTNDAINNNKEALDRLADSSELAAKALGEVTKIRDLQKNRSEVVNKLLTQTPEEAKKLNDTFVRLQNNLRGGLNTGTNSRAAREAFSQALRSGSSLQGAYRAGNSVLAQQRQETLSMFQDPNIRGARKLEMKNEAIRQKKPLSDEQIEDIFNKQEAQLKTQMAIETGQINNPMVRADIEATKDRKFDPAAARAADEYNKTTGRQADANTEIGRLALVQSSLVVSNSELKLALEGLTLEIKKARGFDAKVEGGKVGAAAAVAAGKGVSLPGASPAGGRAPVAMASRGGVIYANEGALINFQPKGTDTVPAMLTPGEFVINREATQQHLPLLQAINKSKGGVIYLKYGSDEPVEEDGPSYISQYTRNIGAANMVRTADAIKSGLQGGIGIGNLAAAAGASPELRTAGDIADIGLGTGQAAYKASHLGARAAAGAGGMALAAGYGVYTLQSAATNSIALSTGETKIEDYEKANQEQVNQSYLKNVKQNFYDPGKAAIQAGIATNSLLNPDSRENQNAKNSRELIDRQEKTLKLQERDKTNPGAGIATVNFSKGGVVYLSKGGKPDSEPYDYRKIADPGLELRKIDMRQRDRLSTYSAVNGLANFVSSERVADEAKYASLVEQQRQTALESAFAARFTGRTDGNYKSIETIAGEEAAADIQRRLGNTWDIMSDKQKEAAIQENMPRAQAIADTYKTRQDEALASGQNIEEFRSQQYGTSYSNFIRAVEARNSHGRDMRDKGTTGITRAEDARKTKLRDIIAKTTDDVTTTPQQAPPGIPSATQSVPAKDAAQTAASMPGRSPAAVVTPTKPAVDTTTQMSPPRKSDKKSEPEDFASVVLGKNANAPQTIFGGSGKPEAGLPLFLRSGGSNFPKPRNMAEVQMYKEGLSRGMTIQQVKNERQQAYRGRSFSGRNNSKGRDINRNAESLGELFPTKRGSQTSFGNLSVSSSSLNLSTLSGGKPTPERSTETEGVRYDKEREKELKEKGYSLKKRRIIAPTDIPLPLRFPPKEKAKQIGQPEPTSRMSDDEVQQIIQRSNSAAYPKISDDEVKANTKLAIAKKQERERIQRNELISAGVDVESDTTARLRKSGMSTKQIIEMNAAKKTGAQADVVGGLRNQVAALKSRETSGFFGIGGTNNATKIKELEKQIAVENLKLEATKEDPGRTAETAAEEALAAKKRTDIAKDTRTFSERNFGLNAQVGYQAAGEQIAGAGASVELGVNSALDAMGRPANDRMRPDANRVAVNRILAKDKDTRPFSEKYLGLNFEAGVQTAKEQIAALGSAESGINQAIEQSLGIKPTDRLGRPLSKAAISAREKDAKIFNKGIENAPGIKTMAKVGMGALEVAGAAGESGVGVIRTGVGTTVAIGGALAAGVAESIGDNDSARYAEAFSEQGVEETKRGIGNIQRSGAIIGQNVIDSSLGTNIYRKAREEATGRISQITQGRNEAAERLLPGFGGYLQSGADLTAELAGGTATDLGMGKLPKLAAAQARVAGTAAKAVTEGAGKVRKYVGDVAAAPGKRAAARVREISGPSQRKVDTLIAKGYSPGDAAELVTDNRAYTLDEIQYRNLRRKAGGKPFGREMATPERAASIAKNKAEKAAAATQERAASIARDKAEKAAAARTEKIARQTENADFDPTLMDDTGIDDAGVEAYMTDRVKSASTARRAVSADVTKRVAARKQVLAERLGAYASSPEAAEALKKSKVFDIGSVEVVDSIRARNVGGNSNVRSGGASYTPNTDTMQIKTNGINSKSFDAKVDHELGHGMQNKTIGGLSPAKGKGGSLVYEEKLMASLGPDIDRFLSSPDGYQALLGSLSKQRNIGSLYDIDRIKKEPVELFTSLIQASNSSDFTKNPHAVDMLKQLMQFHGFANGGMVYAANGALMQARPSSTDTVPAMLTPGEFVVNRASAQEHMPLLQAINNRNYESGGLVKYMAQGGVVTPQYRDVGGAIGSLASSSVMGAGLDMGAISELAKELPRLKEAFGSFEKLSEFSQSFDKLTQNMGSNLTGFAETVANMPSKMEHSMKAIVNGTINSNIPGATTQIVNSRHEAQIVYDQNTQRLDRASEGSFSRSDPTIMRGTSGAGGTG